MRGIESGYSANQKSRVDLIQIDHLLQQIAIEL
jgi:hypothetical protein